MILAQIKSKKIEYQKLDTVIRENVPFGFFQDTVDITNVLRPVYNFKAGGK